MAILYLGYVDAESSNSAPNMRTGFLSWHFIVFSHEKNATNNLFQLLGAKVAAQHRSETHLGNVQIHCFAGPLTACQPKKKAFWE